MRRLPASPHSPAVSALGRDTSAFSALERALASLPFFKWRTENGHRCSEFHELLLTGRALAALLEEDTAASRDALREWLPPPNELVRTARFSALFEGTAMGAAHPSLACARLHATRLAAWDAAATGEQQADAACTPATQRRQQPCPQLLPLCVLPSPLRSCGGRVGRLAFQHCQPRRRFAAAGPMPRCHRPAPGRA